MSYHSSRRTNRSKSENKQLLQGIAVMCTLALLSAILIASGFLN